MNNNSFHKDDNENISIPMLKKIEGTLFKKVDSKLTRIFKKSIPRYFYFDMDKHQFGYKENSSESNYKRIHIKKEFISYSPSVERDEPWMNEFKYGFKFFTTGKVYTLFLNDKKFYDQWMRMFNFYFYGVDVLVGRNSKVKPRSVSITYLNEHANSVKKEIKLVSSNINVNKADNKEIIYETLIKENKILVSVSQIKENKKLFQVENLHYLNYNQTLVDNLSSNSNINLNKGFIDAEEEKNKQNIDLNRKKANISKRIFTNKEDGLVYIDNCNNNFIQNRESIVNNQDNKSISLNLNDGELLINTTNNNNNENKYEDFLDWPGTEEY
jgi:hypothetical protein